jgi:hypothetical protein
MKTTTDDKGNHLFEMERSRDEGATWQPQTRIQGTSFRGSATPEHAEALRNPYLKIRGSAPPPSSRNVPDGLGELSTETLEEDGKTVRVIRSRRPLAQRRPRGGRSSGGPGNERSRPNRARRECCRINHLDGGEAGIRTLQSAFL